MKRTKATPRSRPPAPGKVCGRATAKGKPCLRPAGTGTKTPGKGACAWHKGQSLLEIAVRQELNEFSKPIQVSPQQAMGAVMRLAAGQLAYASEEVARLRPDELFTIGYHPKSETLVMVPHHWVALQREIMNDLAKYAKLASDAGLAERGQVLAEKQTEIVANLIEKVVESIDLTPAQKLALGPALRREMEAIETEGHET